MNRRPLGRSGIAVSEIGFGAWGIGGATAGRTSYGETDDRVSLRALEAALDLGIDFFDTAPVYGDGRSERLIGQAIAGRPRDRIAVCTKAGCLDYHRPLDFSPAVLERSVAGSLERLGLDCIDLLMLHDPRADEPGLDDSFEALLRMRRAGRIRAIGVSVRAPADIAVFVPRYPVDAFQVNLNLLDQRLVAEDALSLARGHGAAVVARTPLCFGFLTGLLDETAAFDAADHRSRWSAEQVRLWQSGARLFADMLTEPGQTRIQAALRFCLSFDGVASVIPGILTPAEARENASASALGPYPPDAVARIRAAYDAHSFFDTRPRDGLAMEQGRHTPAAPRHA